MHRERPSLGNQGGQEGLLEVGGLGQVLQAREWHHRAPADAGSALHWGFCHEKSNALFISLKAS